jgi:phosphopantetheinyl transferase
MPLLKEWKPNEHSLAAIWHICEPESFFMAQTQVTDANIQHNKRRIEFLAGRFLLQYLHKDFPIHEIYADEHDKPQIPNQTLQFSISHSFPYAACIISKRAAVGIDIQSWHKSIAALQYKFLTPQEQIFCGVDEQKITQAWTAKEAAYKYQGRRGVDFKEHLVIENWEEYEDYTDIKINFKLNSPAHCKTLNSLIFNDFALSICI